jgi:hypothetical protein
MNAKIGSGEVMLLDKALKNITTGMIFRTRENGDVLKVIFRDGMIRQILINEILVDNGSGVSGEDDQTLDLRDLVADDWEDAKGF